MSIYPNVFHLSKTIIKTLPKNPLRLDRKGTRLNSSHANISYAVFCLKKKNSLKRPDAFERLQRMRAREHLDVRRHLVVVRSRRVQPAADCAGDLGQPALDGHVDVLVF